MTFPYKLVKPRDSARRAPWTEEKEESASHHWLQSFALRCCAPKMSEKTSEDTRRRPEVMKKSFFRTPQISTFSLRGQTFWQSLQQLTSLLKITFDNLKCQIVRLKLHSWYLDWNRWKHDFPIWTRRTSRFSPKGPLNWRKGGECFAPLIYNHLLCAAARRKCLERRPKTSGDDQKSWICHILRHLKFQHFFSGHRPFDMYFNN